MQTVAKLLAPLAAAALWLAGLAIAWSAEPPAGTAAAKVVALSGEAKVGARGLKLGDAVAEGDEVASGRGGYATLEFTDRSIVRMMPDSSLRIEMHRAATSQVDFETRLRLRSGALEAVVAKRRAPNFSLVTTSGSIAVRGTSFRVRGGDESMLVEVIDGRVEVAGVGGRAVAVSAGFGTKVTFGEEPLAPVRLLGVPNISRIAEQQRRPVVRLRFAPLAGAERYRIIAALDPDLREVLVENTQRRPDVRMIDLRDGEYFFAVRAIDALGLEGEEARGRFRLHARPLPPAAQAPEPDATLEPGSVTFSWSAAEEAATYRFQLANDEDFTAPLVDRGGLPERELPVNNLPAGNYYWRVASVRASGEQGPFFDSLLLMLRAPAPPSQPTQ